MLSLARVDPLRRRERAPHRRERLGQRQGRVVAFHAELVASVGGEELVEPVASELVGVVVRRPVLQVAVDERRERGRGAQPAPRRGRARVATRAARRTIARALRAASTVSPCGSERERAEHPADRVGLPDVAEDLVGVEEVVHGDEVEARAELLPEQPFRDREQQRPEARDAEQDERGGAVDPRAGEPVRCEREPQQERRDRVSGGNEVEREPQRKAARELAGAEDARLGPQRERDPREGADRHEHSRRRERRQESGQGTGKTHGGPDASPSTLRLADGDQMTERRPVS